MASSRHLNDKISSSLQGTAKISEQEGFKDEMSDIPDDAQMAARPQPANEATPTHDSDQEMRDAPAFSMSANQTPARVEKGKKAQPGSTTAQVLESQAIVSVEGIADQSSAVTAFRSDHQELRTESEVQQTAIIGPLDPQMTILLRGYGEWREVGLCRRRSIIEGITKVREQNQAQQLFLFTGEGRGLALEDCATHNDDVVCLNTDTSGFPAEVEFMIATNGSRSRDTSQRHGGQSQWANLTPQWADGGPQYQPQTGDGAELFGEELGYLERH
ncbi:hypothetical protein VDGL01_08318 [Verticillium dahliae]